VCVVTNRNLPVVHDTDNGDLTLSRLLLLSDHIGGDIMELRSGRLATAHDSSLGDTTMSGGELAVGADVAAGNLTWTGGRVTGPGTLRPGSYHAGTARHTGARGRRGPGVPDDRADRGDLDRTRRGDDDRPRPAVDGGRLGVRRRDTRQPIGPCPGVRLRRRRRRRAGDGRVALRTPLVAPRARRHVPRDGRIRRIRRRHRHAVRPGHSTWSRTPPSSSRVWPSRISPRGSPSAEGRL
jgi:hypothetical protein